MTDAKLSPLSASKLKITLEQGEPRMKKILFVCYGNAIRSQMAEGFARVYGREFVSPASCGLYPAHAVDPRTILVMEEVGIDIFEAFPKSYSALVKAPFDWVVNISGEPLPENPVGRVTEWDVADPVGGPEEAYRRTRDRIQKLTIEFLDQVRAEPASVAPGVAPEWKLDRKRRLRRG
jgi:arsenate reductase